MTRKRPVNAAGTTESDDLAQQAPTQPDPLAEALAANASLVRLIDGIDAELDRLRLAIRAAVRR
jgi:hypothetical protein